MRFFNQALFISILGLSPLASAQSLICQIYDIATAQVLAEGTLALDAVDESTLMLEAIGVEARVFDKPAGDTKRVQRLEIDNYGGTSEGVVFNYDVSDIGIAEKFPHVASEIPGQGDTVFFYCR